ncbi:hypothetical protein I4U23_016944 [Adineta vaga]|nr:hypothetical protein I4U23_016944 [Adineta vaga]
MQWEPHDQCLYFVFNETLRDEDRNKLKPWFLHFWLFHAAHAHMPSHHGTVYRGIKSDVTSVYRTGDISMWRSFSSCTALVDVLESGCDVGG